MPQERLKLKTADSWIPQRPLNVWVFFRHVFCYSNSEDHGLKLDL